MRKLLCINFHCLLPITFDDFTTSLPFLAHSCLLFLILFNTTFLFFCYWHNNHIISQLTLTTISSHSRNLKAVIISSLVQLHTFMLSSSWRKKCFPWCNLSPAKACNDWCPFFRFYLMLILLIYYCGNAQILLLNIDDLSYLSLVMFLQYSAP